LKKQEKEKLKLYGVRLRSDQIEFLKDLDDAARIIRELIDNYILDHGKPNVILLNKKISITSRKMNEIIDSPLYKACKFNINRWQKLRDYEEQYKVKSEGKISLMSLVTFRLLQDAIPAHSKDCDDIIHESREVFNSFQAQLRKMKAEIEELRGQLKKLPEE